jgi:hypothetical protein
MRAARRALLGFSSRTPEDVVRADGRPALEGPGDVTSLPGSMAGDVAIFVLLKN